MLTIYCATNIPPVLVGVVRDLRAVWAAEELDLPYKIEWLDAKAGEHRAEWYRAYSAFQKFPALADGEAKLFESAAIVAYLADKARRMIPPPGAFERSEHDQWLYAALNTIEPSVFNLFLCDTFWSPMEGVAGFRAAFVSTAQDRLASLDKALANSAYLTGDDFQACDIVMAHVLGFIRDETLLEGLENLRSYRERCFARPAYQKALAIQTAGKPAVAA
jgi:glutathione S-transferase